MPLKDDWVSGDSFTANDQNDVADAVNELTPTDSSALVIPTSGAPSDAVGLNGDLALDRDTGLVYEKSADDWDNGVNLKSLSVEFPATGATLSAGTLNVFGGVSSGTFNLPAAAGAGAVIVIKNQSTGTLTVDPNGAEVINDEAGTAAATIALIPNAAVTLTSDGFDWQLISGTNRVARQGIVIRSTSGGLAAGYFTVFSGSTASQTLSLPTAASAKGVTIGMKNISSVSVTIDVSGGGSIFAGASGASTAIVTTGSSFRAISDEFEWLVI